jgi:hypothetical protein
MTMAQREDIQSEYATLMALFGRVVDSKRGQKLPSDEKWLYDAEIFGLKLFNHSASLLRLSLGTVLPQFGDRRFTFCDYSSMNILARAAFEAYLSFCFIFCDANSGTEERKFRHLLWRLSGPMDRKDFTFNSESALRQMKIDKEISEKLLEELQKNSIYLSLGESLRKKARKGEWRLGKSWADLAELAGFNRRVFQMVYKYLCSYAHAGGLSGLQIQQAVNSEDQKGLSTISLHFGLLLMSNFLFSYISLFPENKSLFIDDPNYSIADKWHIMWKEEGFKHG